MAVCGIDPGVGGYAAVLDYDGRVEFTHVPVVKIPGRTRTTYDLHGVRRLVTEIARRCTFVIIEAQQAFPGEKGGVVGSFVKGYGYGVWMTALAMAGVSHETIRSQDWRKRLAIPSSRGDRKAALAAIVTKAQSLFPNVDLRPTERCRVPSHDMAAALLLAECARRNTRV